MIKLLFKRLGQGVLVIFVLQTITFFLVRLLPGNPFLGERKLPEHVMAQLNALYGLDQSALVQYGNYWKGILCHGDFGPSLVREGVQVADIIAQAFPVSLWLGVLGMGIAILLGIPAGMMAAYWRNRWPDALFMLLNIHPSSFQICVQLSHVKEFDQNSPHTFHWLEYTLRSNEPIHH